MAKKKKRPELGINPMALLYAAVSLIGLLLLIESVGMVYIVSGIAVALKGLGAVPSGLGILYVYSVIKLFIGLVGIVAGVYGFYKETK